jgi:hypothetical protein
MSLEARHAILDALLASLDEEHALAVMEHRKTKKCALTAFAAKLLAKQFALCPDPNAAAEEMIIRGWTGFKADWMRKTSSPRAGKRNFVDAAMDRINGRRDAGNNPDAQCLPDGQQQPGSDAGHVRIGYGVPFANSRH